MLDKLLAGMIRCGSIDPVDLVDAIESTLLQVQIEAEAAADERITTLKDCLAHWKARARENDKRLARITKDHAALVNRKDGARSDLLEADGDLRKVEDICRAFFYLPDTWGKEEM